MLTCQGCGKQAFDLLAKLISESKGVLITGHRNSDFDTVGAGYGIFCLVKSMGIPAYIITDRETTLAAPLLERIAFAEGEACILTVEQGAEKAGKDMLCVLLDTSRISLLECEAAVCGCGKLAIIDHHLKLSEFSDREGLYIHDDGASSCCEMVSRMFEQGADTLFSPDLCDLLAAGIILDTRGFSQRAGAETFFVMGRLSERGADLVAVRNFFDCTREHYKKRAIIVNSAVVKDGMAISTCHMIREHVRTLAPQAANELTSIEGVNAAFVLFKFARTLCVSARSDGIVDVAEIMAVLGGGGTRTMAAAQLPRTGFLSAKCKLHAAIAKYRTAHT